MRDDKQYTVIFEVAQEVIGRKRVPIEKKGYSIDAELKSAIKNRRAKNKAWRVARKNRQENEIAIARDEYMAMRKRVQEMKADRRARKNDEMTRRVMSSGAESSAVFWKQVLKKKKVEIDKLKIKGEMTEDVQDIKSALQDHWEEVNDPQWGGREYHQEEE